ncbi:MAG: bacteriohemerythrin [Pseudomonadota bacterium]
MEGVQNLLVWDDGYATGVTEIDEQHMILVHTLNEASVKLAGDASIETLEQITQDLLAYALYHFETEEALMQEYGYEEGSREDAARHLEQHRAFSAKVVAVRDGLKTGTPIAPADLLAFLNDWLVNHILNTDKRLGAYIVARREATA